MSERYRVTSFDELAAQAIPRQALWHTLRSELQPSFGGTYARTDDLASIRDDPRFPAG